MKKNVIVKEFNDDLKEKLQQATDDVINLLIDKYGMNKEELCLFFTTITEGFEEMGIKIHTISKQDVQKFRENL